MTLKTRRTQTIEQIGPSTLPPPGDARQDELKRRADVLEEEAEKRAGAVDGGAIDPEALEPINEIMSQIGADGGYNVLEVSNAQSEYRYSWVYTGQHGLMIKAKLAARGWEVVQGDMPEAQELKGVGGDTTRHLGDVVLMRCRLDYARMQDRFEREKADRAQASVTANLAGLGDKYRKTGLVVRTSLSEEELKRAGRRAHAEQLAGNIQDRLIREGRMPGVAIPGGSKR